MVKMEQPKSDGGAEAPSSSPRFDPKYEEISDPVEEIKSRSLGKQFCKEGMDQCFAMDPQELENIHNAWNCGESKSDGLAMNNLFTKIKQRSYDGNHVVQLSYLEVYNEIVRDLLLDGRPMVLRQ